MARRKLSEAAKKRIASFQNYRCANNPNSNLDGFEFFICPLWKNNGDGVFDHSGYVIDHITEHCLTQDDDDDNLQALCASCHLLKTRNFMIDNTKIKKNNTEIKKNDTEIKKNNNKPYMSYQCDKCKKTFDRKSNYQTHLNRIFPCVSSGSKTSKPRCQYCKGFFSNSYSIRRHINNNQCSELKNLHHNDEDDEDHDITVATYEYDSIKDINLSDLEEVFNDDQGIIIGLLRVVNFNKNKPKHHNIYYSNIKSNICRVFSHKWEANKIDIVMLRVLCAKINLLIEIKRVYENYLDSQYINLIDGVIKNYRLEQFNEIKYLIKDMILFAFNESYIPKNTYNKTKHFVTVKDTKNKPFKVFKDGWTPELIDDDLKKKS